MTKKRELKQRPFEAFFKMKPKEADKERVDQEVRNSSFSPAKPPLKIDPIRTVGSVE